MSSLDALAKTLPHRLSD